MIVWITRAYSLGLVAYSIIEVTARAFYAQQNAWIPLLTITLTLTALSAWAFPWQRGLEVPGSPWRIPSPSLFNSSSWSGSSTGNIPDLQMPGARFPESSASVGGGLVVVVLYTLVPFETLGLFTGALCAAGVLGLSGLLILPFIWPEIKLLKSL